MTELTGVKVVLPVTIAVPLRVAKVGQVNNNGEPFPVKDRLAVAAPVTPQLIETVNPTIVGRPLSVARVILPERDN